MGMLMGLSLVLLQLLLAPLPLISKNYQFCICQDKLLLGAILVSFSRDVNRFVSSAQISYDAWSWLATIFARPFGFVNGLLNLKVIILSLMSMLFSANQLMIMNLYCMSLMVFQLRISLCDTSISFGELCEKLVEHATFLKGNDNYVDDPAINAHVASSNTSFNNSARCRGSTTKKSYASSDSYLSNRPFTPGFSSNYCGHFQICSQ